MPMINARCQYSMPMLDVKMPGVVLSCIELDIIVVTQIFYNSVTSAKKVKHFHILKFFAICYFDESH